MVNWQISNAVFTLKFNTILNLDKIANKLINNENIIINYEPETFPGLLIIFRNLIMNGNGRKLIGVIICII